MGIRVSAAIRGVALALCGCAGAGPEAEGVVSATVAEPLSAGSVKWINGTYTSCNSRSGAWSARVSGVAAMDNPTLTVIANDTARPGTGVGKLINAKLVRTAIVSHIGLNPETQRQMIEGELAVELVPQGTLIERIRAGASDFSGTAIIRGGHWQTA